RLRDQAGLPVMLADEPLEAVVRGAGKVLDELSLLRDIAILCPAARRRGVMLEFLRRNRLLATAALFLVLAAGMILRTGTSHERDDELGRIFLELMAPLERAGTFASRTVADAWERASGLLRARDEAGELGARVRQVEPTTARIAAM